MAVGDKALYTTVRGWYDRINTALNYSNGISRITTPSANSRILASNVNNLCSTLNSMKSDTYLRTHSYSTYTTVSTGTKISNTIFDYMNAVTNGLSTIRCRNNATNNQGDNGHGADGNGNHQDGDKSNGSRSNGSHGDGGYGRGTQSYGTRGNGYHYNGTRYNGSWGNGTRGNGTVVDIYNSLSSKTN